MFQNCVFLLFALLPSAASSYYQQEESGDVAYGGGDSFGDVGKYEKRSRLDSRSMLVVNKPELLAMHFPDIDASKQFTPLKGAYDMDERYKSFDGDDTRKAHAKTVAAQFNTKSKFYQNFNDNDISSNNRGLFTTGHLAHLILEDCRAGYVYSNTDYDDGYQPICGCIYNELINEVLMECYLGDENCTLPEQGQTTEDVTCIGTHEIFFFSDEDGDLANKLTCIICRSGNCDGITEICTEVAFNSENEPIACQLIQLPAEGSLTGNISEVCECDICGDGDGDDDDGDKGVEHTCFGNPTNGCDTESYAVVHNFASESTGGPPIGGLFGDVCNLTSPDRILYSHVTYDANYSTICDCDDPSVATIECDLYHDECHANTCTDISEHFFFDEETGDYKGKWTMNWETGLWTQVLFDSASGSATNCSVIGNDPLTGEYMQCTMCKICYSKHGGRPGIAYDCFEYPQPTRCDTSDGRATYNFEPTGGALTTQQSNSKNANGSKQRDHLPWMATWP